MNYEKEILRAKNYYTERLKTSKDRLSRCRLVPGALYMLQRKEEETNKILNKIGLVDFSELSILEVGCGNGSGFNDWENLGVPSSQIYGIDLMESLVEKAKKMVHVPNNIRVASSTEIPFGDETFDIVSQVTVFTSILDHSARIASAKEMLRVVKKGGVIFWYDFRYPSPGNPNVSPVNKKQIYNFFPNCQIHIKSVTLIPHLSRALAPFSFTTCRILEKISMLRSHYVALIKK